MKNLYDIYCSKSSDKTLDSYKSKLLKTTSTLNPIYKESAQSNIWVGYQSSSSSERIDSDSDTEKAPDTYIDKLAKSVVIDANPRKIKQKEFISGENITWLGVKPTHFDTHSINPEENGKTIYRNAKGTIIDPGTIEKPVNPNEERLKNWVSGDVQRAEKVSLQEMMEKEKNKPFARHEIDSDYEEELKKRKRFGDPAADFLGACTKKAKFVWENRFSIAPGKKWDGVDRTSGFEQRWLAKQGRKVWENTTAYKNFASEL